MDNNHAYGSLASGQDDIYEDDHGQHHATDSQGGPYIDDAPWGIQRFQVDTGPWNQSNVGIVQGQTWLSSDGYVPTCLPNHSDEAVQGSDEGAQLAEPENKNDEKDNKKKKSGKSDANKGAKRPPKKDEKEGDTKKKHHGPKGHRHGHGHSRGTA